MRIVHSTTLVFALCLAAAGCGGPSGAPDAGETPDGGGDTGDAGNAPDAGEAPLVTVSGHVYDADAEGDAPLAGATVDVVGVEGATTTSGADGAFTLEFRSSAALAFVRAVKGGWAEVQPAPLSGERSPLAMRPIPEAVVARVVTGLGQTPDTSRGVIVFAFAASQSGGGETAEVAAGGESFVVTNDGAFLSTATAPSSGNEARTELIVHKVPTGDTTVTVHGAVGASTCEIATANVATWPVLAKTITRVNVACSASGPGRTALVGRVKVDHVGAAGTRVSIDGSSPLVSTVSGPDGAFVLSAPLGNVLVSTETAGAWTNLRLVEATPERAPLEFDGPSDATVVDVATQVGTTAETAKGIVSVEFDGAASQGGERATLSAAAGTVFSMSDTPVLGPTLAAGKQTLVFAGVAPGTTTITATGSPYRTDCVSPTAPAGGWPVRAHTLTHATVTCTQNTSIPMSAVSGQVRSDGEPVGGTLVELVDAPSFHVVTDDQGRFVLEIPTGDRLLRTSKTGYWSFVQPVRASEALSGEVRDFGLVTNARVESLRTTLGLADLSGKGAVVVQFDPRVATSGQSATLSVSGGTSFTFDAEGLPITSATTVLGGDTMVGILGLTPGTTTVVPHGAAGETCTLDWSIQSWPIEAGAVTQVHATCTAPN